MAEPEFRLFEKKSKSVIHFSFFYFVGRGVFIRYFKIIFRGLHDLRGTTMSGIYPAGIVS